MLNGIGKINWKQNRTHLSEVFIDVMFASKKEIRFPLNKDMVNHIYQMRDDKIEFYFRFDQSDQTEVWKVDFSELKPIKPLLPLLKEKMTLPKMNRKDSDAGTKENGKVGVYSIFHPDSNRWLTDNGWGYVQSYFDIVPEKTVANRLSVSIAPKDAVNSGAAWGVKNINWQESTSSVSVPEGNCVVEFKPLEGWDAPNARQIDIEEDGENSISAEYTVSRPKLMRNEPLNVLFVLIIAVCLAIVSYYLGKPLGPGTLSAALSPPEAVKQGAQWRIENGQWQIGGEKIEIGAGEYALEFKPLDGWQSPSERKISVKEGQVAQIDVAYSKVTEDKIKPETAVSDGTPVKSGGETRQSDSDNALPLDSDHDQNIESNEIDSGLAPAEKSLSDKKNTDTEEPKMTTARSETEKKNLGTQSGPAAMERSITVQIAPSEAVQAGARWKLEGPGGWKADGEKISGLINIPYTVIFKHVEGWKTPRDLELTAKGTVRIVREAVYEKIPEARAQNP